MKNNRVLITGVSGYLGMELLQQLLSRGYKVVGVSRNLDYVKGKYRDENVAFFHPDELEDIFFYTIDAIVHCAFSRKSEGDKLANSLDFLQEVLDKVIESKSNMSFVNISTQAVYGKDTPPLWSETTTPNPDYLYAMAKYASELMCDNLSKYGVKYTSLRLPGITGAYDGLKPEITSRFVQNALNNLPIQIVGGTQVFSNVDLGDVVGGILALIENAKDKKWERVYNLGHQKPHSIVEIADTVKKVAQKLLNKEVIINITDEEEQVKVNAGLDSSKFYNFTNWQPQRTLEDTITELFLYLNKK